ncbi:threonine/homoserine efflux transporter RhtA [Scopulibacillus darangshiensis]|uniref:Threonine/homoserine efflux transporter RhtA n=1 Tax=Scopulibacillus darangshiensis TaxID=442528 RepID=A0A4R2P7M8_9BACL|nr:DMT family transporter [Scopulibacillus darangshiensis]TCP29835.1 threonine/homoserine efflux transporter RhtA [Scopulibacillus darangshiensis]
MTPKINPIFIVVLAVFFISTSAIFVKLSDAPSAILAFYRLFFAAALTAPFLNKKQTIKVFKEIKPNDIILCVFAGICLAFHFILWFVSLDYTSIASSTVLVTLQPLFAFAGAVIVFKEKMPLGAYLAGLLAVIGSFIISWGDFLASKEALFGDIIALLACLLVTLYFMAGQKVRQHIPSGPYTYIVYVTAAVVLFIYNLVLHHSLFHYSAAEWMLFLLLAILPTLLGHSLLNWAVPWVGVSTISMSILVEPVGAAVLAYIILGETIHVPQMIGGSIILLGIYYYLKSRRKAASRPVNT